jgi:hypothetical protein
MKEFDKKEVYRCIYCGKLPEESGRSVFSVWAPGTYYQCWPVLCPENEEKVLPDGSRLEE